MAKRVRSLTNSETVTQVPLAATAIAERAYAHFLARGGQHGQDWADWFQAEEELRAETYGKVRNGRSRRTPTKSGR